MDAGREIFLGKNQGRRQKADQNKKEGPPELFRSHNLFPQLLLQFKMKVFEFQFPFDTEILPRQAQNAVLRAPACDRGKVSRPEVAALPSIGPSACLNSTFEAASGSIAFCGCKLKMLDFQAQLSKQ